MMEFSNRINNEKYFDSVGGDAISVACSRAVLRLLPFAAKHQISQENFQLNDMAMCCFLASAYGLSVGIWRKTLTPLASELDTLTWMIVGRTSGIRERYLSPASANLINSHRSKTAVGHALAWMSKVLLYEHEKYQIFESPFLNDINFCRGGGSAKDLSQRPLWQKAPAGFLTNWKVLREALLKNEFDRWFVWTDWYEDRVKGVPLIKEVEVGNPPHVDFGRITLPVSDYRSPGVVNLKIKAIVDNFHAREDVKIQDNTVETFGLNEDGHIDQTTQSTSDELTDTSKQRDWYKSLRGAALGLKEIGENALGRAVRPVSNLLDALPEELGEAKVAILWPAANRVRRLKSSHDKAVMSGDEYHPNRLSPEVVDDIDQFVGIYNNLVLGDENLAEADKRALGPQDVEDILEAGGFANTVLEVAIVNDLLTDEAKSVVQDVITEDIQIAKIDSLSVLERLALDNNARVKNNAIRALIIQMRDSDQYRTFEGGFFKSLGGGFATALMAFVAMQIPAVQALVASLLS